MAIDDQLEKWRIELAYLEQEMSAIHMHKVLWRTTVNAIAETIDASVAVSGRITTRCSTWQPNRWLSDG